MNNIIYQLKNLKFAYDSNSVLDISKLSLETGKIYAFLGGNGSGKTTLLKILNGLLKSEGVLFEGSSDINSLRQKTVFVHQNPLLLSGSVYYNVALGLKLRKESNITEKVGRSLETVGLAGFEKRKCKELSGGEVQRVALARALILNPEVLILDEPTANIDKQTIQKLSKIIKRINKNTTIIISTHNHAFAYHNCDVIIHLENGTIQPGQENIFKGETINKTDGFSFFKVHDLILKCPETDGDFNTVVVDYKDVILSDKPIETSARNKFKGKVVSMQKSNNLFTVTLDVGIEIVALITEYSVSKFNITEGKDMYLAFKTSAIKLY